MDDEKQIEDILNEKNELKKMQLIRDLIDEDLIVKYSMTLEEGLRAAVTYKMKNLDKIFEILDSIHDEKCIAAALEASPYLVCKFKYLSKVQNADYKARIIKSIKAKDSEIISQIGLVSDEYDKALILSTLKAKELKVSYLDQIKDINNQALIIMTSGDEDLKKEYIDRVTDDDIKTLLICSLMDKELKDEYFNSFDNKHDKIRMPDGMTVGMEIESEGENSLICYTMGNFLNGWNAKADSSLEMGLEITTPPLTNSNLDTMDLYYVCKTLEKLGQSTSSRCGAHIHVGADYLTSKQAYVNLIEIWANNEDLMLLISNPKGQIPRDAVTTYSAPISKNILEAIERGEFDDFDLMNKNQFILALQESQEDYEKGIAQRTALNFLNVNSHLINTIEFRGSNGTINPNEWIENATLDTGIIAFAEHLSYIQRKSENNLTPEDKKILSQFELLTSKETDIKERLNLLTMLCVPEDMKEIYIERYECNSELLSQHPEIKDAIYSRIAKEQIKFFTDTSIRKIAAQQGVYAKKEDFKQIVNRLEKDKSLDKINALGID